uniref:RNA polymerase sigma-70 region 2 domain-containing protein n=1 Tax=Heterosigma akashiwo TaxID=2829 RepID=A0A7S4D9F1_HETAK
MRRLWLSHSSGSSTLYSPLISLDTTALHIPDHVNQQSDDDPNCRNQGGRLSKSFHQKRQSKRRWSEDSVKVNPLLEHWLLDRQEEQVLVGHFQELKAYEKVKEDMHAELGREPSLEEWAFQLQLSPTQLQQRIQACHVAKQALISHNIKLVAHLAKSFLRFRPRELKTKKKEDLIQKGILGLSLAAERFDPTSGHKFSTYATYYIRNSFYEVESEDGPLMNIPRNYVAYTLGTSQLVVPPGFTSDAAADDLKNKKVQQIVDRLKLKPEVAQRLLMGTAPAIDDVVDGKEMFQSWIKSPNSGVLLSYHTRERINNLLQELFFEQLGPRQCAVMSLRYGVYLTADSLVDPQPWRFEEIAEYFHYKVSTVKTMVHRSHKRLRTPENRMRLMEMLRELDDCSVDSETLRLSRTIFNRFASRKEEAKEDDSVDDDGDMLLVF